LAILALLVIYYAAVFFVHSEGAHEVALETTGVVPTSDHMDLEAQVVSLDPSEREMGLEVQPIPKGEYASANGSEMSEPMRLLVSSPGRPPVEFDFPAGQALNSVVVAVGLNSGAYGYPFDHPEARARFEMITTDGDSQVPLETNLTNASNDWRLSGTAAFVNGGTTLNIEAKRDALVTSLAIFYLLAIGLTAIISVAVIGTSLTDGEVTFSEVIWLGAMLVAIPAMRNEMPGAPAIGTAIDVFVFFPAVGVVAMTLLAATLVLAQSRRSAAAAAAAGGIALGVIEDDED
jgi:hypothetical protein